MSFTPIPVIDNDKTNQNIFFYYNIFDVKTATKRKQNDSIFKSYDFLIKRALRTLVAHLSKQAKGQTHHLNKPDYWFKVKG